MEKIKVELTREEIELLQNGLFYQKLWCGERLKDVKDMETGNYPDEVKEEATKLKQRLELTKEKSKTLDLKLACFCHENGKK